MRITWKTRNIETNELIDAINDAHKEIESLTKKIDSLLREVDGLKSSAAPAVKQGTSSTRRKTQRKSS